MVALTGGIGSGKTTVASLLAARGAAVIDADAVARRLAAPDGASYPALVTHFGPEVVNADGTLDRKAIAARVFDDPEELAALNALTHPDIARAIESQLAALAGRGEAGGAPVPVAVVDLPLLDLAARMRYQPAAVVVVDAPVGVARRRLVEDRGFTEADADARIAAQLSRDERRALADVVIDNGGSRAGLEAQVDRLWSWLRRL